MFLVFLFQLTIFTQMLTFEFVTLAPWTFNPSLLLKCLETLRTEVFNIPQCEFLSGELHSIWSFIHLGL
jgi:hypothetical protein